MFYLQVNGLAQTGLTSRAAALEAAKKGHSQRPDAVVVLMKANKVDPRKDREVARLYN
jgi:hypothetical protein